MSYDLHAHSHFSDGALAPADLIALAKSRGVHTLALTDHDTLHGLSAAQQAADEQEISLVKGIELSCTWRHQLLHVVGLNVDPDCEVLQQGVQQNLDRRAQRAEAIIVKLAKKGIDIREALANEIGDDAAPTRPHFAKALIKLGVVSSMNQAFNRYLAKGKPGFVNMQWPELAEVGQWVKAAGGIAVLAHPLRYKLTRTKLVALIKDMKDNDINAIEVSTASTDKQQMAMLAKLAVEHELLASIGSDFHSTDMPWSMPGSAKPLPPHLTPVWDQF